MLARLDGVDRLTRDIEATGEFRLAPVTLGAQHFEPVLHGSEAQRVGKLGDNRTGGINGEATVSIAIVGNAKVCTML